MTTRARLELPVEAARDQISSLTWPLDPVPVEPSIALGRTLARDLFASLDLPPFSNSAMDGYALQAASTASASMRFPTKLVVIGSIDAGQARPDPIELGCAVRIGTGAAIPPGADAVVPFEQVTIAGPAILLTAPVAASAHLRKRGEDIRAGEPAIRSGTLLRPQEIALASALGVRSIEVVPQPRVAIISIGPELLPTAAPAQINDTNGPMLAALVHQAGGKLLRRELHDGTPETLKTLLQETGETADLILTSGGISNGVSDTLSQIAATLLDIDRWTVRLRPGKHYAAGRIGQAVLLSLPGNPLAALTGFVLFGQLALERLTGQTFERAPLLAIAAQRMSGSKGRVDALRGYAEVRRDTLLRVAATENRGSGIVSSLPAANCLIMIPEHLDHIDTGEAVEIRWIGVSMNGTGAR